MRWILVKDKIIDTEKVKYVRKEDSVDSSQIFSIFFIYTKKEEEINFCFMHRGERDKTFEHIFEALNE